jgi:ankyrin repeat protein
MMFLRLALSAVCMAMLVTPAAGQTPPGADEIAAYSGLHAAAHSGDAAAIVELAADGADLEVRDRSQRTAVHIAAFAGKPEALVALGAAGAEMNALEAGRYDAVTIAAVADDPATLAAALAAGNRGDNITSVYDGTALIAAAHLGHHRSIALLIEAGAPLDHVNNLGWTAMIEAVVLGDGGADHQQSLKLLIDAGADRTIADRAGQTPLDLARQRGYEEMVRMLEGQ